MSKVKIQGNASGTGVFTIEAPGTNDPRTLTLPDSTGTLLDENSSLPAANLTGSVPSAALTNVDLSKLEYNQAILAFKIASSNQLAKFQMVDQVIDEYQDATGIDAGNSTNELAGGSGTAKYYEGASVGSATTVVKSYTGSNQTFVVPGGISTLTFKAWGAGGGGGGSGSGGGGGFVEESLSVTPSESLNIKVGGGGIHESAGGSKKGGGGGWTSIDRSATYLAGAGGGGGGTIHAADDGGPGGGTTGGVGSGGRGTQPTGGTQSAGGTAGTGGGAGSSLTGGTADFGPSNDAAGGYNGGGGGDGDNTTWTAGGGGGGYYGGGSGGNSASNDGPGAGGSGYAPAGTNTQGSGVTVANASDSDYSSGTGNGGSANNNGQHGRAVIKYTGASVSGLNLTLQSVATTAESAPTTADLVVLIEDGAGTATVNSDIKGYVSRDGSAFSSAVTFVDEGDWGTNKRILVARNVDISGITSGTSMKYKLTTHNQVASSLETRIHATSLAWA
jgi:hypothetical protein